MNESLILTKNLTLPTIIFLVKCAHTDIAARLGAVEQIIRSTDNFGIFTLHAVNNLTEAAEYLKMTELYIRVSI